MRINIAKDFSEIPGGRKIEEGPYSGQQFREEILFPAYKKIKESSEKLEINFDGSYGYSPSFLDEAFAGLVRETKEIGILDKIVIISNDDASVERKIKDYVNQAESKIRE